jgi:hypothetical protein
MAKVLKTDCARIDVSERENYSLCLTREHGEGNRQELGLYRVELFCPIRGRRALYVLAESKDAAKGQATCGRENTYKAIWADRVPLAIRGWGSIEF